MDDMPPTIGQIATGEVEPKQQPPKRRMPLDGLSGVEASPTASVDAAIGKRYADCTFQGFRQLTPMHESAVAVCRDYVTHFGTYRTEGKSLVLFGPKGTGKDHLMVATIKSILIGYGRNPGDIVYRDGLRLFAEFRHAIKSGATDEDAIVEKYIHPHLLALSDPIPPAGSLSEYEQRMLLRIVDGRYRDCLPMAATLNVKDRNELEQRMGPQAADRLCDGAVLVPCNWASYRSGRND